MALILDMTMVTLMTITTMTVTMTMTMTTMMMMAMTMMMLTYHAHTALQATQDAPGAAQPPTRGRKKTPVMDLVPDENEDREKTGVDDVKPDGDKSVRVATKLVTKAANHSLQSVMGLTWGSFVPQHKLRWREPREQCHTLARLLGEQKEAIVEYSNLDEPFYWDPTTKQA
eukprot:1516076-Karenia_brevis.AAC.1